MHGSSARLLRLRRPPPIDAAQVGAPTLRYLSIATDVCALEYLALVADMLEARGSYLPALERDGAMARAARKHFGSAPLLRRVSELLDEAEDDAAANDAIVAPDEDHHVRAAATVLRRHVPTVWSLFRASVRAQIVRRGAEPAAVRWAHSREWKLLRLMRRPEPSASRRN